MAKVNYQFVCTEDDECNISIDINKGNIDISLFEIDRSNSILLDISTAIKFSKTLQAKIREVKESEDFDKLSNTF